MTRPPHDHRALDGADEEPSEASRGTIATHCVHAATGRAKRVLL